MAEGGWQKVKQENVLTVESNPHDLSKNLSIMSQSLDIAMAAVRTGCFMRHETKMFSFHSIHEKAGASMV